MLSSTRGGISRKRKLSKGEITQNVEQKWYKINGTLVILLDLVHLYFTIKILFASRSVWSIICIFEDLKQRVKISQSPKH